MVPETELASPPRRLHIEIGDHLLHHALLREVVAKVIGKGLVGDAHFDRHGAKLALREIPLISHRSEKAVK